MPRSVIADGIVGTHPLFAGIDDPVDVDAPDSPWTVLAESNPRLAILQAQFAEGQVLIMRVASTETPTKVGNAAVFRPGPNMMARWETHSTHVKLLVEFDGAPTDPALSVALTKAGVQTALDPDTGEVTVTANGERVGGLPRPWIEYTPDDGEPDARTRLFLDWTLDGNTLSVAYPALSDTEWVGALLDPTVIDTSTASTATAYSNQRKVDRCQNGVLWAMFWDGTSTTGTSLDFYYSTDDGATWTKGSEFGFAGTGTSYTPNASLFIDVDDYAHVVFKDNNNGYIYYRRGTPNAARTAWTWSAAVQLDDEVYNDYPDVIAHREGTGWQVHVVASSVASSTLNRVRYARVEVASSGALTLATGADADIVSNSYGNSTHTYPSIDFNHTGDGKTVKDGTPHLYVAWSAGATGAGKGIRFKKATYSGGTWTWGTEREIDSTLFHAGNDYGLTCIFDGTAVVIGGTFWDGSTQVEKTWTRDAADTAHSTLWTVAAADRIYGGSLTWDGNRNLYLVGDNNNSGYVSYAKYDYASSTRTLTIIGNTNTVRWFSAKRGYSNNRIEFIYTDGTASPYSVTYDSISTNDPPTLTNPSPADGAFVDLRKAVTFDAAYADPNGNPLGDVLLRRQRLDGTIEWWNGSAWQGTEVVVPGSTLPLVVPAGAFTEQSYRWSMAATDSVGAQSAYTPWRSIYHTAQFVRLSGAWAGVSGGGV